MKVAASPAGTPWMWTLAFGTTKIAHRRTATIREAAMAGFARSWWRE
jgi:hypothetical protein